ncbi:outer membrane beta-barrel protein [Luteibaculum oceani]|uniref:PorT family protein n=1 Tax=Luteibaculum oceani TaxID=1294296 RepID=A0A5C6VEV0_9FLAO|nr:outer membrane beta-barrel protein [Luteibaculum oceani]TXC81708.1 PorT family protein [Luteibaculum oceani]
MKKSLLVLITFCSFGLFAQEISLQGGVSFGALDYEIAAFPNSNLYEESTTEANFRFSFLKPLKEGQSLDFGLGYLVKSGQNEFVFTNNQGEETGSTTTQLRFNYLSLSGLYTYNISSDGIIPYVQIGPKLDVLIDDNTGEGFDKDNLNSVQFGAVGGLGVKKEFGKMVLGLISRYHLDFNKIGKWQNDGQEGTNSISGNRFTLNASISYRL